MSNGMEINQVLAQMRVAQANAQGLNSPVEGTQQVDFASIFKQSLDKVNETQKAAGGASSAFAAGDPDVNLSEVMISLQKASVAFQATVEVRNKLLEAYNEVKNIQV